MLKQPISNQAFLLILYWYQNSRRFADYEKFQATKKFEKFDISSVIDLKPPSAIGRIEKAVMKRCPAYLYVVFESPDNRKFSEWTDRAELDAKTGRSSHILAQLTNRLRPLCPKTIQEDIWQASYQPSTARTRVLLYVVYD
jgi:hypothetical protein